MKKAIIILHGWGVNGKKYEEVVDSLRNREFTVFAPDLPGFGNEKLEKKVMSLDDYVEFAVSFFKKNNIKKAIIIGHSFGGRVGAKLAYKYPELVEKLIITGSPLIKHAKLSSKKRIASYLAIFNKKLLKFLPENVQNILRKILYFSIGEWDYYKAGELRETFKMIINEDLSEILPKINIPTLIVWGENDLVVPLADGKNIATMIKKSELIIVPESSHKLPYEKPTAFIKSILPFLT